MSRLHRIVALKGLGFSLEQIASMLEEGVSADQMQGMLRMRKAQIQQQLAETEQQLADVDARLKQIELEERVPVYEILIRRVEPLLVAMVRTILPSHEMIGSLFAEVYEALGKHKESAIAANPGENGNTLVLWYDTEFKDVDVEGAAAFVLRHAVPSAGRMQVVELSAQTMAATIHHGSYDTIGVAHNAVLSWIDANGYRVVGADREVTLFNRPPLRRDDESYVTEIQYPVERREVEKGGNRS
jgi:effector-binding domain-containing protein